MVLRRRSQRKEEEGVAAGGSLLQLRVDDTSKLVHSARLSQQGTEFHLHPVAGTAAGGASTLLNSHLAEESVTQNGMASNRQGNEPPSQIGGGPHHTLIDAFPSAAAELETLSEEEQRTHEIHAMLASSRAPLLAVPLEEESAALASEAGSPSAPESAALIPLLLINTASPALPSAVTSKHSSPTTSAANALAAQTFATARLPAVSAARVAQLGNLSAEHLGDALQAVTGAAEPLPPDEIQQLFKLADLDHSAEISFREFLVAVALGYFLREDLQRDRNARAARVAAKAAAHATAEAELALAMATGHEAAAAGQVPSSPVTSLQLDAATATGPRNSPRLIAPKPSGSPPSTARGPSANPAGAAELGDAPPAPQRNNLTPQNRTPVLGPIGTRSGATSSLSSSPAPSAAAANSGPPPSLPGMSLSLPANERKPSNEKVSSLSLHAPQGSSLDHTAANAFHAVARGFRVVYTAFNEMDADGSGQVDPSELKRALFSAAPMRQDQQILEQRFAELDIDASGEINLPEFLYGVVSWSASIRERGMQGGNEGTQDARLGGFTLIFQPILTRGCYVGVFLAGLA
jgi:Ca2+-binding EF-hand superfamily protein